MFSGLFRPARTLRVDGVRKSLSCVARWGTLILLGVAPPLGAEFQINSFTSNAQRRPAISHDSIGGFVVVWDSYGQDGSTIAVLQQRFDSNGNAVGGEFLVNSLTFGGQSYPAISHDSAGGFVVVWQTTTGDDIAAQRFNSNGDTVGGEFQVNTHTPYSAQRKPAISHSPSGNFTVVWQSYLQDGSYYGIFAQQFDSSGERAGNEFQVNSYTSDRQRYPSISHDSGGGLVIVWDSLGQDGSLRGIFGQRFNSDGSTLGTEFQVNTVTTSGDYEPVISHDTGGEFWIVWDGARGNELRGVFGQRFESNGDPTGGEFQINSFTPNTQFRAALSRDSIGNVVVAWESINQDGASSGIFGQRFDGNGSALGGEFQINSFTTGGQFHAAISHAPSGEFAVVWSGYDQDGSYSGVFGQRFPALSIADASIPEDPVSTGGSSNLMFTASLSSPADGEVQVSFMTMDGTASSPSDFTASSGTAMIANGQSSTMIPVPISGDTLYEHDEDFAIGLSDPVRATLSADSMAMGTILNDDDPPTLSIDDVQVTEGDAGTVDAVFTVSTSTISGVDATVDFMTADDGATAGEDYMAASGMLLFPAMSTAAQQIFVTVSGDTDVEPDENFLVNLSNPVDATIAAPASGSGTILNDDIRLILTGPAAGGASTTRTYQVE